MITYFSSICRTKTTKLTKIFMMALAAICLFTPQKALAEGFSLQDWSARGGALAGGVVARGGDVSTLVYNPAAMTELPGFQVQFGAEFVSPTNSIEATDDNGVLGSTKSEGSHFILPNAYFSYKLNDRFSLGLATFSRFGLGNEYHENWQGRYNVYDVNLATATVNPVIAWRVNDMLSLAAGLEISGAIVEQRKKINFGSFDADAHLESEGITWAFGFNLAAHLRFNEQWKAGLTYRSGMDFDFDGEMAVTSPYGVTHDKGTTTLALPHEFKAAVAYYPREDLSFEFGLGYYTWSSYKNLDLQFENSGLVESPRHWDDTWFFSLSAEYEWLEWLTLRAGISYETSPVPDEFAEYSAPVDGRFKYAAGLGFHKDSWALDLAYIFHDMNHREFTTASNHHPGSGVKPGYSTDTYANAVVVSFSYKF